MAWERPGKWWWIAHHLLDPRELDRLERRWNESKAPALSGVSVLGDSREYVFVVTVRSTVGVIMPQRFDTELRRLLRAGPTMRATSDLKWEWIARHNAERDEVRRCERLWTYMSDEERDSAGRASAHVRRLCGRR